MDSISFSDLFNRFCPRYRTVPLTISPGGTGINFKTESMLTDFPQPLSPTTASVSPSSTWNEIPLTAYTVPSGVWKRVIRSLTSRSEVILSDCPAVRIESITQPIAQKIDAQHGYKYKQPWKKP